jgi:hypothetical protein
VDPIGVLSIGLGMGITALLGGMGLRRTGFPFSSTSGPYLTLHGSTPASRSGSLSPRQ